MPPCRSLFVMLLSIRSINQTIVGRFPEDLAQAPFFVEYSGFGFC